MARLNGTTLSFMVGWTVFAVACILPTRWITLPEGRVHGLSVTLSGVSAIGQIE